MRTCSLDVVARSEERGMGGDTLRTWHNKFGGTCTSQTFKGKEEFKVTTGAGEVIHSFFYKNNFIRTKALILAKY